MPRHPDVVAEPGPIPAQRLFREHLTKDRDAQIQWTAGGVTADQLAAMGIGQGKQAGRKRPQPALIGLRQRQGQREGQRSRPHGSQVRQIDRERLVAQRGRIDISKKVARLDQHVGRDGQCSGRNRRQQRAIVTDAQQGISSRTRAFEMPPDQVEFTGWAHVCSRWVGKPTQRSARPDLGRSRACGDLVEHAVDELVAVGAAEGLGEFDCLVDDHPIRDLEMAGEFESTDQQCCMLDRRQLQPPGDPDAG